MPVRRVVATSNFPVPRRVEPYPPLRRSPLFEPLPERPRSSRFFFLPPCLASILAKVSWVLVFLADFDCFAVVWSVFRPWTAARGHHAPPVAISGHRSIRLCRTGLEPVDPEPNRFTQPNQTQTEPSSGPSLLESKPRPNRAQSRTGTCDSADRSSAQPGPSRSVQPRQPVITRSQTAADRDTDPQ
ncbi:hypothetical protein V6N13_141088 [Hibiscus sabdariffa]